MGLSLILLYSLAIFSLFMGIFALFTLVEKFPIKLLYYHARFRKLIVWTIFLASLVWVLLYYFQNRNTIFPTETLIPLGLILVALLMTYKIHQDKWFQAVDFPKMTKDIASLPIEDDKEIAIIEVDGITKAYPLNYVIHHHIINDKFGNKIIALTYCAMCRSIIPFDVSDLGPLFVASFKNANMIVADKKTKTFFQQATFQSVIGKLHPHSLSMIQFQILTWKDVKSLNPVPEVAVVSKNDFRAFKLPMPGVWKKVMSSELTPGLSSVDKTFPSKTLVVGIIDSSIPAQIVYLKKDIIEQTVVRNEKFAFTLISTGSTVNGYKNSIDNHLLDLSLIPNDKITDKASGTIWDLRGKYIKGNIKKNLEAIAISDEYWFSWKNFHPNSQLVRL